MKREDRIDILSQLGDKMLIAGERRDLAIRQAKMANPWFTEENSLKSIVSIANSYLEKELLIQFANKYEEISKAQNVGIICAGNIPLVGTHDLICVLLSGHILQLKLSEKDTILMTWVLELLQSISPELASKVEIVERLNNFDAVIATGSNNTSTYFKKYFEPYPHIIRRNRHGVAVLNGNENREELINLGNDIFSYFGLGCRNVSKIYLPDGYDISTLMEPLHSYNEIILHHKYKNNFDYNMALFLLNKDNFFNNGCLLVKEDKPISSRIASCHFEYYSDLEKLNDDLIDLSDQIQCIVSNDSIDQFDHFVFGTAQNPGLSNYADGVDVMDFLTRLN